LDDHFRGGVIEIGAAKELVALGDGIAGDGVDTVMDGGVDAADETGTRVARPNAAITMKRRDWRSRIIREGVLTQDYRAGACGLWSKRDSKVYEF